MGKKQREKQAIMKAAQIKESNRNKRANLMSSAATIETVDPHEVVMEAPASTSNVKNFAREKAQRESGAVLPSHPHGVDMAALWEKAQSTANGCAVDYVMITVAEIESWCLPEFQREFKHNAKVAKFTEGLKANQEIAGIITLGYIAGKFVLYKVDGQHRLNAALACAVATGNPEFIAHIHIKRYRDFSEMADDFTKLNDSLVNMRKDDILRAAMENSPMLQRIVAECPHVGFDNVRRATTRSKTLSMSAALNCWIGSAAETPTSTSKSGVPELSDEETGNLRAFLNLSYAAWSNDPANDQLWKNLNLTMCMWMFRRLVLKAADPNKKLTHTTMPADAFKRCLARVSADRIYNEEFLRGRGMKERDRAPCYKRLKEIFTKCLHEEKFNAGKTIKYPKPAWSHGKPV